MKRQKVMDDDLYLMANIPIHHTRNINIQSNTETNDKTVVTVKKSTKTLRKNNSMNLIKLLKIYLRKGETGLNYFDTTMTNILEWMEQENDEIKRTLLNINDERKQENTKRNMFDRQSK
jgi:hypothetical protein